MESIENKKVTTSLKQYLTVIISTVSIVASSLGSYYAITSAVSNLVEKVSTLTDRVAILEKENKDKTTEIANLKVVTNINQTNIQNIKERLNEK